MSRGIRRPRARRTARARRLRGEGPLRFRVKVSAAGHIPGDVDRVVVSLVASRQSEGLLCVAVRRWTSCLEGACVSPGSPGPFDALIEDDAPFCQTDAGFP